MHWLSFCFDSLQSCSQIYKHKILYLNYNNLFFSNDLLNNRLKINGCVEKYYGEMVALIQKCHKSSLVLIFYAMQQALSYHT